MEAAYLAGIFDGEGCLYIKESYRPSLKAVSRRSVLRACVVICNTHLPLLEAIQACYGGAITSKRLEYYKGRKARQSWELYWNGQNEIAFLMEAVRPYLIIKRDQVECFIEDFVPTLRSASGAYHLTDQEYEQRKSVKDRLQLLKRVEYPAKVA